MAEGTTPYINLIKPDVGGSDDTWGEKLNGNFDKIDAAIGNINIGGGIIATIEYVDDENAAQDVVINGKASIAYVDSENDAQDTTINGKASIAYVDSENAAQDLIINGKVDQAYVDSENDAQDTVINSKASTIYVDNQNATQDALIATKVSQAYVDSANAAQDTAISGKVSKTGDTMTGMLTLSNDPFNSAHAATKNYVDFQNSTQDTIIAGKANLSHTHTASQVTDFSEAVDDRVNSLFVAGSNITLTYNDAANTFTVASTASGDVTQAYVDSENAAQDAIIAGKADTSYVNSQDALRVAKSGDTMSGFLTLHADPTSNNHAATKKYVDDNIGSGTGAAVAYIADSPPTSPVNGQLWWESDTGHMFIYYNDGTSAQWVPVVTTPYIPLLTMNAPVLDLITDGTDYTPDFTLTGDLLLGDTIRFQYSTAIDFTGASELTNTIDAGEDAANAISFSTGDLAEDTWYFRARIERTGYANSPWSNVETIEITGPLISPEVSQFLDRTSGLDATHIAAYTALIDGLVADNVWAKIDIIYIYATQDTATAKLNLKSASYPITHFGTGTPTFTADMGFRHNGPTFGDSGLNAFTTSGINYTQNSAHMACWLYEDLDAIALGAGVGTMNTDYFPRQYVANHYGLTGSAFYNVNTNDGTEATIGLNNGGGFALGSRINATTIEGYRNEVQTVSDTAEPSVALASFNFSCPAYALGDLHGFYSFWSAGGGLTSTEALAYYTRLRTYMTAVGVP